MVEEKKINNERIEEMLRGFSKVFITDGDDLDKKRYELTDIGIFGLESLGVEIKKIV